MYFGMSLTTRFINLNSVLRKYILNIKMKTNLYSRQNKGKLWRLRNKLYGIYLIVILFISILTLYFHLIPPFVVAYGFIGLAFFILIAGIFFHKTLGYFGAIVTGRDAIIISFYHFVVLMIIAIAILYKTGMLPIWFSQLIGKIFPR
jgi:hypothetical protein